MALHEHFCDARSQSEVGLDLEKLFRFLVGWRTELAEEVVVGIVEQHLVNEFPGFLSIAQACPAVDFPSVRPASALTNPTFFEKLA